MTSEEENALYRLGAVRKWQSEGPHLTFECDGTARLRLTVLTPGLVRVRVAPNGVFPPSSSWAVPVADETFGPPPFQITETDHTVTAQTGVLTLKVQRATSHLTILDRTGQILGDDAEGATWAENGQVSWSKRIPTNEHYYGFGERTGLLDKLGRHYSNWPVDKASHGPATNEMYQAIPFFLALRPGENSGYGLFFNNSYRTGFDMGYSKPGHYFFRAAGGFLDYYFIYGPTPAQIMEGYTSLTGRMKLPPRWALGYQQCRYSYTSEEQVREVVREFRSRNLPADVIVLDIDYMQGYRVFTWDKTQFPDPARLIGELAEEGFKVVTIVDPGVKYEPGDYPVYEAGLKADVFIRNPQPEDDTKPYLTGWVWPGECVFPDFARAEVRQWWGDQHNPLLEAGVAGIWNDMNEPALFAEGWKPLDFPLGTLVGDPAEGGTWAELHNLYALTENQATEAALRAVRPQARPFILSRAGFAGIQRWAAVWTGDNISTWEHLEMSIPMLCNLSLSGVAFCGTDIGGFIGNADGELFTRWMQMGVLYPFSRGHSAQGSERHEPYIFGPEVEGICRRYLELRYRLLPYLYTLFEEASRTGSPILRPLLFNFPDDPALTQLHDQFMLGEALLAAPVYAPGRQYRYVYLPAGVWYDFWTAKPLPAGQQHLLAPTPLDTMPLYVRGGTILPLGPVLQHTGQHDPAAPLTLAIFPDANGQASTLFYEDAGEGFAYERGELRRTAFDCLQVDNNPALWWVLANSKGEYATGRTRFVLKFPADYRVEEATLISEKRSLEVSEDGREVTVPVSDEMKACAVELKLVKTAIA